MQWWCGGATGGADVHRLSRRVSGCAMSCTERSCVARSRRFCWLADLPLSPQALTTGAGRSGDSRLPICAVLLTFANLFRALSSSAVSTLSYSSRTSTRSLPATSEHLLCQPVATHFSSLPLGVGDAAARFLQRHRQAWCIRLSSSGAR